MFFKKEEEEEEERRKTLFRSISEEDIRLQKHGGPPWKDPHCQVNVNGLYEYTTMTSAFDSISRRM